MPAPLANLVDQIAARLERGQSESGVYAGADLPVRLQSAGDAGSAGGGDPGPPDGRAAAGRKEDRDSVRPLPYSPPVAKSEKRDRPRPEPTAARGTELNPFPTVPMSGTPSVAIRRHSRGRGQRVGWECTGCCGWLVRSCCEQVGC